MSEKNTAARTIHDLGLSAWFGGSLMGAVGLNAAARQASQPTERTAIANAGWARWTPINALGIGAYLAGGMILMKGNKSRLKTQAGVGNATLAKNALTLVTLGATAYARVLGQRLMDEENAATQDGTTPSSETPVHVARAQRQLKLLQYAIPVHVGGLIAITALMGEQQRPTAVTKGIARRLARKSS